MYRLYNDAKQRRLKKIKSLLKQEGLSDSTIQKIMGLVK